MANVLGNEKRQQVLALGQLGWSLRRIEEATGVRRETASRYLRAASIRVRPPGRWGHEASSLAPPPNAAIEVSTDSAGLESMARAVMPGRSPQASACEPYREAIEQAVARGRTAMSIWQDLVDDHGFAPRYASVRRFVVKLRVSTVTTAHPVIVTEPGEEAQSDYGTGPMIRDPNSGRYRRSRLFVLTLGYSRKSVRWIVMRSSARTWAELHERSFRRLGGAPRVIVHDNLREGVLAPDVHDPTLNPLFADVLRHYGVTALPCRVRDPNRKGKVESGVGHAQNKLHGLRFENEVEAQAYLDHWEARWADTRIHGTTKRQVAAMFEEEKVSLLALPIEPFRYYEYGTRVVHLDGCVEVARGYYAAPPGWLGRTVHVQWDRLWVRLLDPSSGQLLREHVRQRPGGRAMHDEDRPARTPLGVLKLLARAIRAGRATGVLCEQIHRSEGPAGVRRILGVLSLLKKYGATRLESACAIALEVELPTYRFVRRYLERQPTPELTLRQVDPLIRELTHYRDLIESMSPQGEDRS